MERFDPKHKDKYPQLYYEHTHRYLVACQHIKGGRVLDIACGEGYGSALLATKAEQVLGLDIDAEAIANARQRYPAANLEFQQSDCCDTRLAPASFDAVVSFETIEHLESPTAFLAEVARLLKPDGLLILSSPDKREYSEANGIENPHHLNELYHEALEELLRSHFEFCHFSKQRLVAGSLIQADPNQSSTPARFGIYTDSKDGPACSDALDRGLYSFAICSKAELPPITLGLYENKQMSSFAWDATERFKPTLRHLRLAQAELEKANAAPSMESLLQAVTDVERQNLEAQNCREAAEKTNAELRHQIETLETRLAEREDSLGSLRRQLETLRSERDHLQERYQRILTTLSWKITVPIRSVRRFLERKGLK